MEKTIVLLHGFGEDHRIFDQQAAQLRKHFSVYTPDLPGSGELNEHEWQPGNETIEWMADWTYSQLNKKGIEKCVLLGHSMGGYITLAFAEKYPEKLEAFGLIHSTSFADNEAKKEVRAKAIQFMKEKGGFTFLKTAIPGLFGPDFSNSNPEAVNRLVEQAKHFRFGSLSAYYHAMMTRPDRSHLLKNTHLPVLIIAGTDDNAVPAADLLKQASMPAICHFHLLENTGHMGMLESPGRVCDILLNFMTDL